tara:strand:+ start:677 stop:829 length:153 start_codon:yes stop_codon:yes gene_type:complete
MDALGITIATPTNNAKAGTNKNRIEKLRKKTNANMAIDITNNMTMPYLII